MSTQTLIQHGESEARSLIERVTRDGASVAPEYPLIFEDRFPGRLVAVGEGSCVRSACAVLVRDFVIGGAELRGGLIGSVCTDPEWRGNGLATRVLDEAEAQLSAQGCAFALLWADEPAFYQKRGYGEIGTEEDFLVGSELTSRLPEPVGVRPASPEDAGAMHAHYDAHPVRVRRSDSETAALLACPGMRTLVLERDGELVAYACCGRGADLDDAVHEWGGGTADVLALVRAHLEERFPDGALAGGRLFVIAPTAHVELVERLKELGAAHGRGILGLGKLLDRLAAAGALGAQLSPNGGRAEVVDEGGVQRIGVWGPEDECVLDDDAVLGLLLGGDVVRPHVASFLERFGLNGAGLPLEPFAWGLDSI